MLVDQRNSAANRSMLAALRSDSCRARARARVRGATADHALSILDFAFVQPPGITLLILPMAFLAKATTTATAMR